MQDCAWWERLVLLVESHVLKTVGSILCFLTLPGIRQTMSKKLSMFVMLSICISGGAVSAEDKSREERLAYSFGYVRSAEFLCDNVASSESYQKQKIQFNQ